VTQKAAGTLGRWELSKETIKMWRIFFCRECALCDSSPERAFYSIFKPVGHYTIVTVLFSLCTVCQLCTPLRYPHAHFKNQDASRRYLMINNISCYCLVVIYVCTS
jgi:hypothetical protein